MLTISPFTGNPSDNQLRVIGSFLKEISKIEDVRNVMDRFVAYKCRIEAERRIDQIQTTQNSIGPKFMRNFHQLQYTLRKDSFSGFTDDFGDIDENSEGEEVKFKVRMIHQQTRANLKELNAPQRSEYDDLLINKFRKLKPAKEMCLKYKIPTNLPSDYKSYIPMTLCP